MKSFNTYWKKETRKRVPMEVVSSLLLTGYIDQLRAKLMLEEGMTEQAANDYMQYLLNEIQVRKGFSFMGMPVTLETLQNLGEGNHDILNLQPLENEPKPGYSFVPAKDVMIGDVISNLGRVLRLDPKPEGGINIFAVRGNVYCKETEPVEIKKSFKHHLKT